MATYGMARNWSGIYLTTCENRLDTLKYLDMYYFIDNIKSGCITCLKIQIEENEFESYTLMVP